MDAVSVPFITGTPPKAPPIEEERAPKFFQYQAEVDGNLSILESREKRECLRNIFSADVLWLLHFDMCTMLEHRRKRPLVAAPDFELFGKSFSVLRALYHAKH